MTTPPNFYEFLDLDPAVREWPLIEARLRERREEYSRDLNQGSRRHRQEAQANLDLLRQAEALLRDPDHRRREAEAAAAGRTARHEARRRELDEAIALIGGVCARTQLDRLIAEFGDVFTEIEILGRLRAAGIEPPGRRVRPPEERLDEVMARRVRDALELLGSASLYEVLAMDPLSSLTDLRRRAEELYRRAQDEPNPDARLAARKDLLVRVKTIFADEEGRRRYDNQLLFDRLRPLDAAIELAGAGGFLDARQLARLTARAVALGVSAADARAYVLEVADEREWRVEIAAGGGAAGDAAAPIPANAEPPPAPTALAAVPSGAGVQLTWQPPAGGPFLYRVLRKAGSPPIDEGDGVVLVETAASQAEDPRLPLNAPCYYAVFTLFGGAVSLRPAVTGPHHAPGAGAASLLAPLLRRPLLAGGLTLAAGAGGLLLLGLPMPAGGRPAGGTAAAVSAPAAVTAPAPAPAAASSPTPPVPVPPAGSPAAAAPAASGDGDASAGSAQGGAGAAPTGAAPFVAVPRGAPAPSGRPAIPRLAVVVDGDPLLLAAAEERLRQGLADHGFAIAGEGDSVRLAELLRQRGSLPPSRLLAPLAAQGVDVLVWLRSEPLAERRLTYFGRTDTAFTARLSLAAYRIGDGRGLGGGWTRQSEYTAVNAALQGRGFADEVLADLSAAVRSGWDASPSGPVP